MSTVINININAPANMQLDICIDGQVVDYRLLDSDIIIDSDISYGFHMLQIRKLSQGRVSINNLKVDGVGIRQFLYLSWVDHDGTQLQPCTELWENSQTWNIPFSNPMSLLISKASDKFTTNEIGKDLSEQYVIHYPESIVVQDAFPKLVKDFFKNNFDFHVYPKALLNDPFGQINVPFFKFNYHYNQLAIHQELVNNQDYLFSKEKIPGQIKYNALDDSIDPALNWRTIFIHNYNGQPQSIDDFALDKNLLPELYNFFASLPVKCFYNTFLGYLPAGGYAAPHRDWADSAELKGCSQMYFSINAKPGNYLKIHTVGSVPFLSQPVVFNAQHFTHSVINQSSQDRWVISIFADVNDNFMKEYVNG